MTAARVPFKTPSQKRVTSSLVRGLPETDHLVLDEKSYNCQI